MKTPSQLVKSPTPPSIIFFDLDDTLLDHKGAETRALQFVHDAFPPVSEVPLEQWIQAYKKVNKGLWDLYGAGKITRKELHFRRFYEPMNSLGVGEDLNKEQLKELAHIVGKDYMLNYRHHWEWIPGAKEIFYEIQAHFPIGILTNGFAETQRLKMDYFQLWETAETVVISEEVGVMKPHPKIFKHAQGAYKPEEVLYVGDSLTSDVQGGSAAGWRTAWYAPLASDSEKLSAPAELIFADFKELSNWLL